MNCHEARARLGAYLDSELDSRSTLAVNAHLAECRPCRDRFAAEQRIERAVAARLQREDGDEEALFGRILDGVLGRARRRSPLRIAVPAAVLAAAALLLFRTAGTPELVDFAAHDHARYASGALAPKVPASAAAAVRDYLEPRVGVAIGSLPETGAWRIHGSRICRVKEASIGYVMLERHGMPVSLFVLSPATATRFRGVPAGETPRSFALDQGHAVLARCGGAVRCAVGEIPLAELEALVK